MFTVQYLLETTKWSKLTRNKCTSFSPTFNVEENKVLLHFRSKIITVRHKVVDRDGRREEMPRESSEELVPGNNITFYNPSFDLQGYHQFLTIFHEALMRAY